MASNSQSKKVFKVNDLPTLLGKCRHIEELSFYIFPSLVSNWDQAIIEELIAQGSGVSEAGFLTAS